ncbi:hypothetical protein C7999DRAFT_33723 [Corynascus novoguineensis]|uniref:Uncharacterized protein n=1 Tax=Corynascus novoguineensis TaxID=1126955 RepID=A0AAN7HDH2_9PEZI|nr:hypothetical protein C7999DRAFT_33723 [Corynascus novoguineensis]
MANRLRAVFGLRKKKSKTDLPDSSIEKPQVTHWETVKATKEPVKTSHEHTKPPPPRGVPIRPTVSPMYSTYSTPVNTRWANSATRTETSPCSAEGEINSNNECVDTKEASLQKKAAQEEQERLDFFQMM